MMLAAAIFCGSLLVLAYGAAAISDALETRVSLESAAGGDTFANAGSIPSSTVSLALDARTAAGRSASAHAPRTLR
jgi:hypothetical protein